MTLGRFELNKVYNEDCYKAIKDIPDKSIDCIYVDIPYLFQDGGNGTSDVAKRIIKLADELKDNDIWHGIDYKIFEDFVRVLKKNKLFHLVQ